MLCKNLNDLRSVSLLLGCHGICVSHFHYTIWLKMANCCHKNFWSGMKLTDQIFIAPCLIKFCVPCKKWILTSQIFCNKSQANLISLRWTTFVALSFLKLSCMNHIGFLGLQLNWTFVLSLSLYSVHL